MKKLLVICCVLFYRSGIACSGFPHSFCATHGERSADPVIKGTVVAVNPQSIQLKVLEVWSGTESRTLITIWDGKDFDCTGNISMKASGMGSLGDTLLAILPLIQSVQNTWDVVGDYSRPHWLFYEPVLYIKNDVIKGMINASTSMSPPWWAIYNMKYTDFKTYWVEHQGDCSKIATGISDNGKINDLIIRQNENTVYVSATDGFTIRIVSIQGSIITEQEVRSEATINIENYAAGMYQVCILTNSGHEFRKKIIR